MKKVNLLLLCSISLFLIVGCGFNQNKEISKNKQETHTNDVETIYGVSVISDSETETVIKKYGAEMSIPKVSKEEVIELTDSFGSSIDEYIEELPNLKGENLKTTLEVIEFYVEELTYLKFSIEPNSKEFNKLNEYIIKGENYINKYKKD
jgi:viroplasmin and RNaseH domain-containing protein